MERSSSTIQRSLIEMDKETGISIMKIVQKLDMEILIQERIKIEKDDNYNSLSNKLAIWAHFDFKIIKSH